MKVAKPKLLDLDAVRTRLQGLVVENRADEAIDIAMSLLGSFQDKNLELTLRLAMEQRLQSLVCCCSMIARTNSATELIRHPLHITCYYTPLRISRIASWAFSQTLLPSRPYTRHSPPDPALPLDLPPRHSQRYLTRGGPVAVGPVTKE